MLLDTSGVALRALLAAGPQIIKPDRYELEELIGESLNTRAALINAGRVLLNTTPALHLVVVSLDNEGALFLTHEQALHAHPAPITVSSTVGAGDAMVAGLIAAQLEGLTLMETAKLATAFAAATLTQIGPYLPPPAHIRALARQIAVTPTP